ncbi:MAG: hypothetical protein H6713_37745 [Myxococcales bacterium]|nr:hypothetical protein [Myxococcales bacterium]
MALIKKRPAIKLLAPRVIPSGTPFRVRVVLDCPEPLEVNSVSVDLEGSEVWFTSSQYGRHRNESRLCRASVGVVSKTKLGAGLHQYDVTLEIPPEFPGSYAGSALRIEWSVRIHVDIPWWPDARRTFLVNVVHPGHEDERATDKLVHVSAKGGPTGEAPYFEVMLRSREIAPEGALEGAIALSNVATNKYRAIEFRLVAAERLPSLVIENVHHNEVGRWRVPAERAGEGEPVRFKLNLPSNIVPGFRTHSAGVRWFLAVEVDVPWKLDPKVWIPLNARSRGLASEGIEPAALAVGSERVELVWREVARRTYYNHVDGVLQREHGHVHVELRREHQGRRGAIVVGELTYPDLGIGLVRDGRERLRARDRGQTDHLAAGLDDALVAAGWPTAADDRRLRFELDDPGHRVEPLERFAILVFAVAEAFESTRRELPAPAAIAEQLADWTRAARALGGHLDHAAVRVTASRAEVGLTLRAGFKPGGEIDRYVLEVRPKVPISERHHRSGAGAKPPKSELAESLAPLCDDAETLTIDWHRIELVVPERAFTLEQAIARLEQLAGVGSKLSGRVGPYR